MPNDVAVNAELVCVKYCSIVGYRNLKLLELRPSKAALQSATRGEFPLTPSGPLPPYSAFIICLLLVASSRVTRTSGQEPCQEAGGGCEVTSTGATLEEQCCCCYCCCETCPTSACLRPARLPTRTECYFDGCSHRTGRVGN